MIPTYRTFVAIELPRELRARIVEHINLLRRELPDVRASWTREESLHLTLKFFGDVPVADISKVSDAVERAAKTVAPFELVLCGCGSFPPHGRPSVLWIGVLSVPPAIAGGPASVLSVPPAVGGGYANSLATLHAALETECAAAGFPREQRPFHPHLTIARLRKPQGARRLAELHQSLGFTRQSFPVSKVVLFRSELLKEGSKHTALFRHRLG